VCALAQAFQHRAAGGKAGGKSEAAGALLKISDAALKRVSGRVRP
jgi:hypothetical protein